MPVSASERARAAKYRSRAAELTEFAATQTDAPLRDGLMSLAAGYLRLAQRIEGAEGAGIAPALARPTQPEQAKDMMAAVTPPSEPPEPETPK